MPVGNKPVQSFVGEDVGNFVGAPVGLDVVGLDVGLDVVGTWVGESVGAFAGEPVGDFVGETVGLDVVGLKMGDRLGSGESSFVTPHTSVLLSAKLKQPKLPIIPLDSLQQSGSVALMAVQFNPTASMQVLGEAGPAEQPCTVFEQP